MNQDNKTREQNERECLEQCVSMSNDPKFKKDIAECTHAERVEFLLDNGWEWE